MTFVWLFAFLCKRMQTGATFSISSKKDVSLHLISYQGCQVYLSQYFLPNRSRKIPKRMPKDLFSSLHNYSCQTTFQPLMSLSNCCIYLKKDAKHQVCPIHFSQQMLKFVQFPLTKHKWIMKFSCSKGSWFCLIFVPQKKGPSWCTFQLLMPHLHCYYTTFQQWTQTPTVDEIFLLLLNYIPTIDANSNCLCNFPIVTTQHSNSWYTFQLPTFLLSLTLLYCQTQPWDFQNN